VRSSDFEIPKPENNHPCERKHRPHLRWIFVPLCLRAESRVEESSRTEEKEATASPPSPRCAVEMQLFQLSPWMVHYPRPILGDWDERVLPGLQRLLWQLLYAVLWLQLPEDQRQLHVMPKLWEEVHLEECIWPDHLPVCIYDG